MTRNLLPSIWLLIFLAGIQQLPETVYTPSLPDIARDLQTSGSMVEYTLTIYLFSFAIGTLFWGKLSDRVGRKPCVLAGLFVFILGCIACYFSNSIWMLMASRFVQAFGGSIGSVLGQSITRDAFHGPALGKAYSTVGSALAFFPAIGPVVGGLIAEYASWHDIFLFLVAFGVILSVFIALYLPETHFAENRQPVSMLKVAMSLLRDRKVMALGIIVAGCNGITFSYFAEGSFYLIDLLGLSPTQYGSTFIMIAAGTMLGGMVSKKLQDHHTSKAILGYGLMIISFASALFSVVVLWHLGVSPIATSILICITIAAQVGIMFGMCMAVSNALSLALVDYKWCIGTASSIFGFFYYCLISLFTFGMGAMHNNTLLPMPLYFLAISMFMLLVQRLRLGSHE
jgi:Bcr/CflA subfamily drug resistance transporter